MYDLRDYTGYDEYRWLNTNELEAENYIVITRITNDCIWFLADDDETLLRDYAKHFDTFEDAARHLGATGSVIEADAILAR